MLLNYCYDNANFFACTLTTSSVSGGRSAMASAKKTTEKRHDPVESIRRKIQAIRKREEISNPMRQIVKYQSSSFDSPQTNPKKDFEEVLRKMTAAHVPRPSLLFSNTEKEGAFNSSPQVVSPRTPSTSYLSSPDNATYSVILTSSENTSRPESKSSQNYTSLISQIRKQELSSHKDLNSYCSKNNFSTSTRDFDSTSDQSSEFFSPQDSVVKKLSLNEEGKYSSFIVYSDKAMRISLQENQN